MIYSFKIWIKLWSRQTSFEIFVLMMSADDWKKVFLNGHKYQKSTKKIIPDSMVFSSQIPMKKSFSNSQIFLNNSEFFFPLLRRTYEVWCPKGKHKFTFPDLAFEFCLKFCYTTSTTLPDFVGKLYKIPYWVKELNF